MLRVKSKQLAVKLLQFNNQLFLKCFRFIKLTKSNQNNMRNYQFFLKGGSKIDDLSFILFTKNNLHNFDPYSDSEYGSESSTDSSQESDSDSECRNINSFKYTYKYTYKYKYKYKTIPNYSLRKKKKLMHQKTFQRFEVGLLSTRIEINNYRNLHLTRVNRMLRV